MNRGITVSNWGVRGVRVCFWFLTTPQPSPGAPAAASSCRRHAEASLRDLAQKLGLSRAAEYRALGTPGAPGE